MDRQADIDALTRVHNRMLSTKNEELESVLKQLLPKLVNLTKDAALNSKVLETLDLIFERVTAHTCELPVATLVDIVKEGGQNSSIALKFVRLCFGSTTPSAEVCKELCLSLIQYSMFDENSNTICSLLSKHCESLRNQEVESNAMNIFGDFLLDIALSLTDIVRGAVGSVQAGFSSVRVDRLTQVDNVVSVKVLREQKLRILDVLPSLKFLSPYIATAIAIACSCDPDPNVSMQGTFKFNGAMNLFPWSSSDAAAEVRCMLELCGNIQRPGNVVTIERTKLRVDVQMAILRWIVKNAEQHLPAAEDIVLKLLQDNAASIQLSPTLVAATTALTESLIEGSKQFVDLASLAKVCLQTTGQQLHHYVSAQEIMRINEAEAHMALRKHSYNIISALARKIAGREDAMSLVPIRTLLVLFKLLEIEDERLLPPLYTALEQTRQVYQAASISLSSEDRRSLEELILTIRISANSKIRLLSAQWTKALFRWESITVDTLVLLADDSNEDIYKFVLQEFKNMREHLSCTASLPSSLSMQSFMECLAKYRVLERNQHVEQFRLQAVIEVLKVLLRLSQSQSRKAPPAKPYSVYELGTDWSTYLLPSDSTSSTEDAAGLQRFLEDLTAIVQRIPFRTAQTHMLSSYNPYGRHSSADLFHSSTAFIHDQLKARLNDAHFMAECRAHLTNAILCFFVVAEPSAAHLLHEIFALLCFQADANYLATTWRLLNHKLRDALSSMTVKGNAFNSLFHIVEVLMWQSFQGDLKHASELQRFYSEVMAVSLEMLRDESLGGLHRTVLHDIVIFAAHGYYPIAAGATGYHPAVQAIRDNGVKCASILTAVDGNLLPQLTEAVTQQMNSGSADTKQAAVKCLSRLTLLAPDGDCTAAWNAFCDKALTSSSDPVLRFSVAESMVRLLPMICCLTKDKKGQLKAMDAGKISTLLETVQHFITRADSCEADEKALFITVILVLIKQHPVLQLWSAVEMKALQGVIVKFLLLNDAFVQDITSLALCNLYEIARAADDAALAEYLTCDLISIFSRQKRIDRPAGYAYAGEAGRNRDTAETRENSTPGRGNSDGAQAAGGGGGTAPVDPMRAAAEAAAAELGINILNEMRTANADSQTTQDRFEQSFGIYGTVCSIVRKTNENSLLFAVLPLIRRDPSFGIGKTEDLWKKYLPTPIVIDEAKLKLMLPMLFHAKYEPNAAIREIMLALWKVLIPASKEVAWVNEVEAELMRYLASCLTSKNWKDREAACLALETIIPSRSWGAVKSIIVDTLWSSGMSVLDDIRTSTRQAAISFMKTVHDQLLHACTPNSDGSKAEDVLAAVDTAMVLMLDKGLVAPSAEARGFTFGLLSRVVEVAKNYLGKWLDRLVSVLIECMSAMEPVTFQYMQFHTARMQINEEQLEQFRVKLSQSSPMQEALTFCLQSLTAATIPDVVHNICFQLRSGVGLATRVAAAESLSYLAEKYPRALGADASKAFAITVHSVVTGQHMTATLKKGMTSALGALAKVMDSAVLAVQCSDLVAKYMSSERNYDVDAVSVAECLQQIVRRAGERMSDVATWRSILTCSYLGSFEAEKELQDIWTNIWSTALLSSNMGTKHVALAAVAPQVMEAIKQFVADLSWTRRSQGVAALKDALNYIPSETLQKSVAQVLKALLDTIPGQIWSGQGVALEVLADFTNKFVDSLDLSSDTDVVFSAGSCALTLERLMDKRKANEMLEGGSAVGDAAIAEDGANLRGAEPRLNAFNLIKLYIHEASRGEKEYRLAVAKSLSSLPWSHLAARNPSIFFALYPSLMQVADFTVIDTAPVASKPVVKHVAVETRKMNNAALFGNRYGSAPAKPAPRPVVMKITPPPAPPREATSTASDSPVLPVRAAAGEADPAFKIQFVECLVKGLPHVADLSKVDPKFALDIEQLLRWVRASIGSEVWSIRKASVQLAVAVAVHVSLEDAQLRWVAEVLREGMEESKYFRIRVEVVKGVRDLLKNHARERILSNHKDIINSILRKAVEDSQPTVLEAAGEAQQAFLNSS